MGFRGKNRSMTIAGFGVRGDHFLGPGLFEASKIGRVGESYARLLSTPDPRRGLFEASKIGRVGESYARLLSTPDPRRGLFEASKIGRVGESYARLLSTPDPRRGLFEASKIGRVGESYTRLFDTASVRAGLFDTASVRAGLFNTASVRAGLFNTASVRAGLFNTLKMQQTALGARFEGFTETTAQNAVATSAHTHVAATHLANYMFALSLSTLITAYVYEANRTGTDLTQVNWLDLALTMWAFLSIAYGVRAGVLKAAERYL